MLLIIDSGNTNIKWAIADTDKKLGIWIKYGIDTNSNFKNINLLPLLKKIKKVIISNVAGEKVGKEIVDTLLKFNIKQNAIKLFYSQKNLLGLTNCYTEPKKLGSDRNLWNFYSSRYGPTGCEEH